LIEMRGAVKSAKYSRADTGANRISPRFPPTAVATIPLDGRSTAQKSQDADPREATFGNS
jgi:hypothetical protein